MPKELGALLKRAREEVGISQSTLARQSGVPQSAIARLEAGTAPGVTFTTVAHLAETLGLSLDTLAEGVGIRTTVARRRSLYDAAKPIVAQAEEMQSRVRRLDESIENLRRLARRRE